MTEVYKCLNCGKPSTRCICLAPRYRADRALLATYIELRASCILLEKFIENATAERESSLNGDDLKELDKAVTVMKVGFKLVKKVLKAHGETQLKAQVLDAMAIAKVE